MGRRHISTKPIAPVILAAQAMLVTMVLTSAVCSANAQAQDTALRSQVVHWLETTCGVVTESEQPIALATLGVAAVPLFEQAFDAGPTADRVNEIRAAAEQRYEQITAMLNAGRSMGLRDEDLATLRQTPRAAFVGQAVQDFILNYGDAALRATSVIGGPESMRFLRRVAADRGSPHAQTAQQLLRDAGA